MKNILTWFFLLAVTTCCSQINSFYITPFQTDIGYATSQDSHLVVRNSVTNINKLFLFLGGTGSNTKSYQTISKFVGNLGYDVINLSYPNMVAVASLANSSDSLVFKKYRQEICYGTPESPDVLVDTLNSIYKRTVNLLNYLNVSYPNQNWDQYLINTSSLDWSKIVVAGHSQGSGHACYFGKLNFVARVLMFSGPNDYSNFYANSAQWLRIPGMTNVDRHFAYLSLLDEVVDFDKQLINLQGLDLYPTYDTTYVDHSNAPYNNSHCLYTTQSPGLAILHHNVPVKFSQINNAVWTYMLNSIFTTAVETIDENNIVQVYPNPTNSVVHIMAKEKFNSHTLRVFNIDGQILKEEKITDLNSISVDLSSFSNGFYFIGIDTQLIKVVKY